MLFPSSTGVGGCADMMRSISPSNSISVRICPAAGIGNAFRYFKIDLLLRPAELTTAPFDFLRDAQCCGRTTHACKSGGLRPFGNTDAFAAQIGCFRDFAVGSTNNEDWRKTREGKTGTVTLSSS